MALKFNIGEKVKVISTQETGTAKGGIEYLNKENDILVDFAGKHCFIPQNQLEAIECQTQQQ